MRLLGAALQRAVDVQGAQIGEVERALLDHPRLHLVQRDLVAHGLLLIAGSPIGSSARRAEALHRPLSSLAADLEHPQADVVLAAEVALPEADRPRR